MFLIDTHTHIYDAEFDLDREEVIQRALSVGVGMMLMPNVDAATLPRMLETNERFPVCTRIMIGLQPEEVKGDYLQVLSLLEKQLNNAQRVAIGEIGLDFYWDRTFEKEQIEAFETQLDWAKLLGLPLSIHCRNAFDTMTEILRKKQDGSLRGVMHCFTGTYEEAKAYLDLGFHLGLGGVVTYKSCTVRDFLPDLPLDRIVLETDAPYLSPVPHRGKRNEPAFIADTANRIADILQVPVEKLAEATSSNAKNLFRINL